MFKLEDVYITTQGRELRVVPKSAGKPGDHYTDPIKNLLLLLIETSDVRSEAQASEELMKITEFRDAMDDAYFSEFADVIDPRSKGYRPCEVYRMISEKLEAAGEEGLHVDQVKAWFDALPTRLFN